MITTGQFIIGIIVILGIFLISFLVTKYTKYGGGSNYGANKNDGEYSTDQWDANDFDL